MVFNIILYTVILMGYFKQTTDNDLYILFGMVVLILTLIIYHAARKFYLLKYDLDDYYNSEVKFIQD